MKRRLKRDGKGEGNRGETGTEAWEGTERELGKRGEKKGSEGKE